MWGLNLVEMASRFQEMHWWLSWRRGPDEEEIKAMVREVHQENPGTGRELELEIAWLAHYPAPY